MFWFKIFCPSPNFSTWRGAPLPPAQLLPPWTQSSIDSVKYRFSQVHTGSRRIGTPHGKAQTHTWGINYFSYPCKAGGIKSAHRRGSWYYKRTIRTGLALELPASLSQLANSSCLSGKVELLIEWLCSLLAPDGDCRALTSILSCNIFGIILKINKRYPRPSENSAVHNNTPCRPTTTTYEWKFVQLCDQIGADIVADLHLGPICPQASHWLLDPDKSFAKLPSQNILFVYQ